MTNPNHGMIRPSVLARSQSDDAPSYFQGEDFTNKGESVSERQPFWLVDGVRHDFFRHWCSGCYAVNFCSAYQALRSQQSASPIRSHENVAVCLDYEPCEVSSPSSSAFFDGLTGDSVEIPEANPPAPAPQFDFASVPDYLKLNPTEVQPFIPGGELRKYKARIGEQRFVHPVGGLVLFTLDVRYIDSRWITQGRHSSTPERFFDFVFYDHEGIVSVLSLTRNSAVSVSETLKRVELNNTCPRGLLYELYFEQRGDYSQVCLTPKKHLSSTQFQQATELYNGAWQDNEWEGVY